MSARRSSIRLTLDPLGDRILLSATAWVSPDGILAVKGTDLGDAIVVRQTGNTVSVYAGRSSASSVPRIPVNLGGSMVNAVPLSEIRSILVKGEGGADKINLTNAPPVPTTVYGGAGNDTTWGGAGNDTIWGGDNNDRVYGNGGNDTLHGGSGNDSLWGAAGDDMLHGGNDNDYHDGGTGTDYFNGGHGFDRFKDDFDLRYPVRNGFSRLDILQGHAGTCSFNAALAEAATKLNLTPSMTRSGNIFTITLWENGRPRRFAVGFNGTWDDRDCEPGQFRNADGSPNGYNTGEFWPILFQRAYLKYCGVNWSSAESDYWTYNRHNFRSSEVALAAVSGWRTGTEVINASESTSTASKIRASILAGELLIAGGTGHAYALANCYQDTRGFWYVTLYNPWGSDSTHRTMPFGTGTNSNDGYIVLSWSTFRDNFQRVYFTNR